MTTAPNSPPTPEECPHPFGWEYDNQEGERWIADTPEDVPVAIAHRWCGTCGELWFRVDNQWEQKYWSEDEIAKIKETAEKWNWLLDDD